MAHWFPITVGSPELDVLTVEEREKLVDSYMNRGVTKARAHRSANHLRVPEIDSSGKRNRGVSFERRRSTKNRSDISRILDSVEHKQPHILSHGNVIQRITRNLRNCENTLRRFGFGGAPEFCFAHRGCLHAAFFNQPAKRSASRSAIELRRGQHSRHAELRSQQLLNSTHALCDKERMTLSRLPAFQVSRERENSQAGVRVVDGIGIAFYGGVQFTAEKLK